MEVKKKNLLLLESKLFFPEQEFVHKNSAVQDV